LWKGQKDRKALKKKKIKERGAIETGQDLGGDPWNSKKTSMRWESRGSHHPPGGGVCKKAEERAVRLSKKRGAKERGNCQRDSGMIRGEVKGTRGMVKKKD